MIGIGKEIRVLYEAIFKMGIIFTYLIRRYYPEDKLLMEKIVQLENILEGKEPK